MNKILIAVLLLVSAFSYAQDNIILKNGNEINGKIIRVGVTEVEYKRDIAGPLYAIKKSEIFIIKYANGDKDVFANMETKDVVADLKLKYEKHKRKGIALLATGGACLGVGAICMATAGASGGFPGAGYLLFGGAGLGAASIPMFIVGSVQMHKYGKYKREWKEQQRTISFLPTGVMFTF